MARSIRISKAVTSVYLAVALALRPKPRVLFNDAVLAVAAGRSAENNRKIIPMQQPVPTDSAAVSIETLSLGVVVQARNLPYDGVRVYPAENHWTFLGCGTAKSVV